jgi:hypothetical protein
MSYLSRYQQGESENAWNELLALGSRVRAEPVYSDAVAVARETMRRARHNLNLLIPRLRAVGYEFLADDPTSLYPDNVFAPPNDDVLACLAELEKSVGAFPISLRAWYEIVGEVNLMGMHPGIRHFEDEPLSDPLVVDPINDYHFDMLEDWLADRDSLGADGAFPLEIAPDEFHKANISGGSPYSVALPNDAADALVLDEWHNTTFVNYLRICFRWGGFPGFERLPENERPTDLIAHLTANFLPL